MSDSLHIRQRQLLASLLNNDSRDGRGGCEIENHIHDQGPIDTETRLAIYRNAYRLRLGQTIDMDHPVTGAYLGDELFEQMVQGYIDTYRSHYRSLRQYADNLPKYLRYQSPFCDHREIAELARFERLLLTAFDAADASRESELSLRQLPAENWPGLKVVFHPSVQLFESDWNVVDIWQSLKSNRTPPPPKNEPAAYLLWRNRNCLTEFHSLSAVELLMLQLFLRGSTGAEVCEALATYLPENEVSNTYVQLLGGWLSQGIVRQLTALTDPRVA